MINRLKKALVSIWPFYLFCILAIFLVLPQINRHSIILGVDSIFHFNRFYDTMMQLKTGNFNYFLMNFGFGQTGRIINALYGPLFAYIQGFLLLVSKSWFKYQVLSDITLSLVSSFTMYALCKKSGLSKSLSCILGMFYSTSSVVAVWSVSTQFTGWGAAFFPLVVLGGLVFLEKDPDFKSFVILGASLAILVQVHVLSSLIGVLTLIPFFIIGIFHSQRKLRLLSGTLFSVFLFICLSSNVWGPLISIKINNNIVETWPNTFMSDFTSMVGITGPFASDIGRSPTYGVIFSLIIISQTIISFSNWQKISILNKTVTITMLIFLVLGSQIIPWTALGTHLPILRSIIQFPRRFCVVPITTSLLILGLNIKELQLHLKIVRLPLITLLVFSACFIFTEIDNHSQVWFTNNLSSWTQHLVFNKNRSQVRDAFYSADLQQGLKAVRKTSLLDYYPTSQKISSNTEKILALYAPNNEMLTKDNSAFKKEINSNGNLVLKQNTNVTKETRLPVVMYANTFLKVNNKTVYSRKNLKTNSIMQPTIKLDKGLNKIEVGYKTPKFIPLLFLISLIAWVTTFLYVLLSMVSSFKPKRGKHSVPKSS